MTITVAVRLRLSGECPTHPEGLVSPSLFAKRPPRPTVGVMSSGLPDAADHSSNHQFQARYPTRTLISPRERFRGDSARCAQPRGGLCDSRAATVPLPRSMSEAFGCVRWSGCHVADLLAAGRFQANWRWILPRRYH